MNTKKTILLFLLFILLFSIWSNPAFCLPPDPIDCDLDPLDPRCPIDGGVVLLVAAGAGLGLFRKNKIK